jgi:hypothetical protein
VAEGGRATRRAAARAATRLGALERQVLQEVRGAVVGGGLVAAAGIDPHANGGRLGERGRLSRHAHAVGQRRHLRVASARRHASAQRRRAHAAGQKAGEQTTGPEARAEAARARARARPRRSSAPPRALVGGAPRMPVWLNAVGTGLVNRVNALVSASAPSAGAARPRAWRAASAAARRATRRIFGRREEVKFRSDFAAAARAGRYRACSALGGCI